MRGKDESSGSLFSYVDLEARVPRDHPLRSIRDLTNAALLEMSGEFEALYSRTGRPGIAPPGSRPGQAGEASAGAVASGVLLDPLGAPAYGAVGVQPSVPVVCGAGDRRPGVGRDGVHEEPRASAGGRCGVALSGASGLACLR